ncbi:MAG: hypothetical protein ACJ04P_14305 [Halioglobus sp.]
MSVRQWGLAVCVSLDGIERRRGTLEVCAGFFEASLVSLGASTAF